MLVRARMFTTAASVSAMQMSRCLLAGIKGVRIVFLSKFNELN